MHTKLIEPARGTKKERDLEKSFRESLDFIHSGRTHPKVRPPEDLKAQAEFRKDAVAGRALHDGFRILLERFGYRWFPAHVLPPFYDAETRGYAARTEGEWRHTCRGLRRHHCPLCKFAFTNDELVANHANDPMGFAAFLDDHVAKSRRARFR